MTDAEDKIPPAQMQDKFEYWMKMKFWTPQEATLLSLGEIPEPEFYQDEMTVSLSDMMSWHDEDASKLLNLIKREFPKNEVAPTDFFVWIVAKNIFLHESFTQSAVEAGLLKTDSLNKPGQLSVKSSKVENRGAQWARVRMQIIQAALQVINDPKLQGMSGIYKSNKSLHIDNLTECIHHNRQRWDFLKDDAYGTSEKNIRDSISSALKSSD